VPIPRRRRIAAGLFAALLVDAGIAAVTSMPAVAARSAASSSAVATAKAEAVAILSILNPGVSVQRKGKDVFKPATDGQKLHVGDTVQTDGTGFAQVNYTDESFTRLDVDTTFTIESLTDDQGNRRIKGSVDSGRTWNRTTALTESESFEQEGAGATAAVVGTAFMTSCDTATPQVCTFTSAVHGITLTTIDGEVQDLAPLEVCDSTEITPEDADLCASVSQLTLDAILANQWLLENLYLDGLAGFEGIVVVEDGVVVSVTPTPPVTPPADTEEETPPAAAPVIDPSNPVLVQSCNFAYPGDVCAALGASVLPNPSFPAEGLFSHNSEDVYFKVNASAGPSALPFYVVFTILPNGDFGEIWDAVADEQVVVGNNYASDTVFVFYSNEASDGTFTDSATVRVGNVDSVSDPVEIPIKIVNDFYDWGGEELAGTSATATPAADTPAPAADATTPAPAEGTTPAPAEG
jgi:hypothetical protein